MALGGMVGDGIPGLHAVGILTVLGQDSFQESLESVNQRDSTNIPTKNEACALLQSKGEIMTFRSLSFCRQQASSLPVFRARD